MARQSAATQTVKETAPVKLLPGKELRDRTQQVFTSIARRAFELFDGRGRGDGHDLADWFRAEAEFLHPIHLDLSDSGDAFMVRAEAPGFSAKELEVGVEPRRLIISGQHETSRGHTGKKSIYTERCSDQIYRAINLPGEIDPSKVTTTFKDGVLALSMPKAAKPIQAEERLA
jgi:HSP20 family protein